ncbi:CPBP family glutamic-type intramembrane protease [Salinirubrum litoreum]|uniref:Type II CAAX prenyl endopeptidase Rce1 family protein n=1 Tax=Salinirubrum litoreum TaxID=1126234 RepID=A0ABD5RD40_9EURY|nr:CPBP family glutamic-type intramembrane protease [Salinirubrum litoreum]
MTRTRTTLFGTDLRPPAVFVLATVVVSATALAVFRWLAPQLTLPTGLVGFLATTTATLGILAVTVAILRWEGVRPTALGISRYGAAVALGLVAGIWLVLNLAVLGVVTIAGGAVQFDLPSGLTPVQFGFFLVEQLLFVGLIEEFAWRGYLQSKLIDWASGRGLSVTRARAVGLLAAAVLFALWHVPQRVLIQGLGLGETAGSVVLLVGLALFLGLLYEATRSVVFVGLVHGSLNLNPVFVTGGVAGTTPAWVGTALLYGVPLLATLVAVVVYRRYVGWSGTRPGVGPTA